MSIIEQAKRELAAINFGDDDSAVMIDILERFFGQWDSGGAVSVAAPVLRKLIAGNPLSPLMGTRDEWMDVGNGVLQNSRCSSVFIDPRFHDGKAAYDLNNPKGARVAITFPYTPSCDDTHEPLVVMEV